MFTEKQPGAKRVALVGCAALKSKKPGPAKEFYTSALFRAAYEYAEKMCDAMIIVILAGEIYADALLHGAHWHNLPLLEQPLRRIRGCGVRVKCITSPSPVMTPALPVLGAAFAQRGGLARGACRAP